MSPSAERHTAVTALAARPTLDEPGRERASAARSCDAARGADEHALFVQCHGLDPSHLLRGPPLRHHWRGRLAGRPGRPGPQRGRGPRPVEAGERAVARNCDQGGVDPTRRPSLPLPLPPPQKKRSAKPCDDALAADRADGRSHADANADARNVRRWTAGATAASTESMRTRAIAGAISSWH